MDSRMTFDGRHGATYPLSRSCAQVAALPMIDRRSFVLAGLLLALASLMVMPAQAQYYYNTNYSNGYSYPSANGTGYNQQYYGVQPASSSGIWGSVKNFFSSPSYGGPDAGIGRTGGGAAGLAIGSMGGAALAAAVIKAGGSGLLASPIAPVLIGSAITAAGAYVGSKLGSHGGVWADQKLGPDMTWTLMGASAGAIAGFALLPKLGPFAGPAGRALGAALGGVAGGVLGKMFAPQLNRLATPPMLYGAAGAAVGGMGMGIPGALVGAVGGYLVGNVLNKGFFAEPGSSTQGDIRRNVYDYQTDIYRAQNAYESTRYALQNSASNAGYYANNAFYSNGGSPGTSPYYGTTRAPQSTSVPTGATPAAPESMEFNEAYNNATQSGSADDIRRAWELKVQKDANRGEPGQ